MTPKKLREIADRPHVSADAQEALYEAAKRIEELAMAEGMRQQMANMHAWAERQMTRSASPYYGGQMLGSLLGGNRSAYEGRQFYGNDCTLDRFCR